jgi:uncharacterized membrane protein required for colicin V production
MLDLAIIFLLAIGFFVGLKRGFILQLFHLTSFIIAYIVANLYYEELAPKLTLWIPYPNFGENLTLKILTNSGNMETAFYRAIAFVIIFFAVKVLLQIIGSMLDFIAHLPIIRTLNIWAGGILGFLENYLFIFILLYIAALIPIGIFQNSLDHSILAKAIVKHTPLFSKQLENWWIK